MKYQKISSTDTTVTFRMWADSGEMEEQTYGLSENETEDELMNRVTNHFDCCVKTRDVVEMPKEEKVYPIMEVMENGETKVCPVDEASFPVAPPMAEMPVPPPMEMPIAPMPEPPIGIAEPPK